MVASTDGINEFRIDPRLQADPYREDYSMRVKAFRFINGIGESKEVKKYVLTVD